MNAVVSLFGNANVITSVVDGKANQVLYSGQDAINLISVPNTIMLAIATALVLFMVPGLAFFYGGLVRRKNAATIILQTLGSMVITTLIWIFFGFSLAFGSLTKGGFIGNITDYPVFKNILFASGFSGDATLVVNTTLAAGVPFILWWLFQLAFAIITPSLVVGAFADRVGWKGYILFTTIFTIFVYIPVTHWIWGGGYLAQAGVLDWAGGIVIHATCGAAAIASVLVIKRRKMLKKESNKPHSIPLVAIGAGVLFFGWFGFNTGGATYYAVSVDSLEKLTGAGFVLNSAAVDSIQNSVKSYFATTGTGAFVNTAIATFMGMMVWLVLDRITNRKPTLVGALTGAIAGLATITPAAGYVPIWASICISVVGALICYAMAKLNHKAHFDDALEVWPVHGVGGVTGAMLIGAFANGNANSLLGSTQHINSPSQIGSGYLFGVEVGAWVLVVVWTLVFTVLPFVFTKYVLQKDGVLTKEEQIIGTDRVVLGEEAYGSAYNIEAILRGEGEQLANTHDTHFSNSSSDEPIRILSAKVDKALYGNDTQHEPEENL